MKKAQLFSYPTQAAFALVFFAMFFYSCEKDGLKTSFGQMECTQCSVEQAFPNETGITHTIQLPGETFVYQEINGHYVYGGDVLLTQNQVEKIEEMARLNIPFKGVGKLADRWPNGVVYYSIDKGLANKQRVIDAMATVSASTSITFQQAVTKGKPSNRTPNYVKFRTGSGCSSYVGMIGGAQDINLATGCSTGNTIHEICHALGIYHEQSRIDRDFYVLIHTQNISAGAANNFSKVSSSYAADYTPTLDFGSIMMYSSYAFSSNGLPTITKLDGSTFTVQRNGLSGDDIATIDVMYP